MAENSNPTWIPLAWCDEYVPADLLASPNHYLEFQPNGSWDLTFPDDHPEHNNKKHRMPVEHGQIIEWISNEYLGHRTLTIKADGTYELDNPFPVHATIFWLPEEWECTGDTLDELVGYIRENHEPEDLQCTIAAAWWSEAISKRLEINPGEPVRFVDCAGVS